MHLGVNNCSNETLRSLYSLKKEKYLKIGLGSLCGIIDDDPARRFNTNCHNLILLIVVFDVNIFGFLVFPVILFRDNDSCSESLFHPHEKN